MVFRIPMRLAISDFPGDAALNGLMFDGAHWSVRLATKVLLERAQAAASPWYPYLQARTIRPEADSLYLIDHREHYLWRSDAALAHHSVIAEDAPSHSFWWTRG